MKTNNEKSLPLYGVGPLIVYGQFGITAIAIILTYIFKTDFARISVLRIPFLVTGILLILLGTFLDLSAKLKSKIFQNVKENKLVTTGVYAYTRNPVYSGALLASTGAVCIANNLLLLVVPFVCWAYMTVFLKKTEEIWLKDAYGKEYEEYCKQVNRCIPWFPRKK